MTRRMEEFDRVTMGEFKKEKICQQERDSNKSEAVVESLAS